ncbi:DUF1156 domain-containing protein [Halorussus salinus]|uniref:DUF1156 domain-containing protein n=1 Tax=Halorussus salinus TaxID=1364935 RepID=UPI001092D953|nr:DUF1156 domain-containing protein [Halorussus salinus]
MSDDIPASESEQSDAQRRELPIERGFPIERVNEIAEKESRAKMYYRPIYTMHKWWARRLGCVFRAISLYTLLDDPEEVSVDDPGQENETLADFDYEGADVADLLEQVDMTDPESLWDLYPKDVTVEGKKVLDPFMGGGTSLVEASRFGAEVVGNDLNPVAWFVTKKELEAGRTDVADLEAAFEEVRDDVADDITQYYRTPCPNGDHEADVMYNFWVKELDCVSCDSTVPLYRDFRVAAGRYENDDKYNVLCPACEEVVLVDDWQSESDCSECGHEFTAKEGHIDYGDYICPDCGQKYPVTDTIEEQGGFDIRLYAVEYYCPHCDEQGCEKSEVKGYKSAAEADKELFEEAKQEWENSDELRQYVPDKPIRSGWSTDANQFDGSMSGNGNLPRHGYETWTDLYNERQLLALSKLAKSIDKLESTNIKEYLLTALSDSLRTNCMMVTYDGGYNKIDHIFRINRLNPPLYPVENNVWGTKFGRGTFTSSFDIVKSGVEYAKSPTERYVEDGETSKTAEFSKSIGDSSTIRQGDVRNLDERDEYDLVITDPPYYNNVLYSELSDYFYVWLKPVLENQYDCFEPEHSPRSESIVVNPASDKDVDDFESELKQAFSAVRRALKENGVLTFTYHHSDSESWGELLEALCEVGFTVTATYPVSADLSKFLEGESVSFDIVVVARPAENRTPISWNDLRRNIYETARETRTKLEENRDLSLGDIGVIEMGECFREYSKHHGKVQHDGEILDAKDVVDKIYGIIQEASDEGIEDVFVDLLGTDDPSYDDVNKLCRGTSAAPEELAELRLYTQDDGFQLGTWDNEARRAYIEERVNGEGGDHLTNLDKIQFLRYRYEEGKKVGNYLDKWTTGQDLRDLAGRLADATDDDAYRRVLGNRDLSNY